MTTNWQISYFFPTRIFSMCVGVFVGIYFNWKCRHELSTWILSQTLAISQLTSFNEACQVFPVHTLAHKRTHTHTYTQRENGGSRASEMEISNSLALLLHFRVPKFLLCVGMKFTLEFPLLSGYNFPAQTRKIGRHASSKDFWHNFAQFSEL